MKYKQELIRSMNWLSKKKDTIFLGQSVNYTGNAIFNTLKEVDQKKKIELPVFEELQMGISTGMALEGLTPISCYPRFDFMILAMNQLVNHLDKVNIMSQNGFKVKAIIRTGVGSQRPLHPQYQHIGDFTEAVKKMCSTIDIIKLDDPKNIFSSYEKALNRNDGRSTLLVEFGDYYNEK